MSKHFLRYSTSNMHVSTLWHDCRMCGGRGSFHAFKKGSWQFSYVVAGVRQNCYHHRTFQSAPPPALIVGNSLKHNIKHWHRKYLLDAKCLVLRISSSCFDLTEIYIFLLSMVRSRVSNSSWFKFYLYKSQIGSVNGTNSKEESTFTLDLCLKPWKYCHQRIWD